MSEAPISHATETGAPYEVLARKYRPQNFSDLIGQQAMVRTLTNAFESGRLAHAFILSGVRGVGKTTTARIIAKALNCIGPEGDGDPTVNPCGVCEPCRAIAEDRHVDVLEMDAASRTGVDDIRELIEGVRYRPVSARYKVYIIDEVHMLSRNAFNALLKTLEEPPEHVKFVFATTEIRRVPVTVLSRCQRFDLRRIDVETLAKDFARIAALEGAQISDAAISLIARAADGSDRDGLSLLDQAIATSAQQGAAIDEADLRDMLGLADRARSYDLLEAIMKGAAGGALSLLEEDYRAGADPLTVLRDLLEVVHWLTRLKAVPSAAEEPTIPEIDRTRGVALTAGLSMASLSRAWQTLLKGLHEAQSSPAPIQAVEMVLIRLAYLTELPSPADIVKTLTTGDSATTASDAAMPLPANSKDDDGTPTRIAQSAGGAPSQPQSAPVAEPAAPEISENLSEPVVSHLADPQSFDEVVELADAMGGHVLRAQLVNNIRLLHFEPGKIEFSFEGDAPPEISNDLVRFLNANTDRRWVVSVAQEGGGDTLSQQAAAIEAKRKGEVADHPLVRAIIDTFPGAEVETVRDIAPPKLSVSGEEEETGE